MLLPLQNPHVTALAFFLRKSKEQKQKLSTYCIYCIYANTVMKDQSEQSDCISPLFYSNFMSPLLLLRSSINIRVKYMALGVPG